MEKCVTVRKVKLKDEAYFLKVVWSDDITLVLVNKDQHWTGVLTQDKIEYFYTNLNMTKDEYVENAKKALTTDESSNEFVVNFANDKFTWEKCIELSSLKMKHGVVEMLQYSPNGGTEILADELLRMLGNTEAKLQDKDDELVNVAEQLHSLLGKYRESTDLKIKMEEDLYTKFMLICNEKKQKIAECEEFIKGMNKTNKIPAIKAKQDMMLSDSE